MDHPAAPYDRVTRVLTVVGSVLLAAVGVVVAAASESSASVLGWLLLVALVAAWALSPARYRLDGPILVVERRGWPAKRLPGVTAVRVADDAGERFPWWSTLRLGGSGGLFGWYGVFWRRRTGRFLAYVTDRHVQVVVERGSELPVVVSPADPDAFVRAWEAWEDRRTGPT